MFGKSASQLVARRLQSASAASAQAKVSVLPPNIGSLKELGKFTSTNPAAHPELFARLKSLYVNLPKGPAPVVTPTNFGQWYYQKYAMTDSPMPLVHFLVLTMVFGYYSIAHIHDHVHPNREFH